jgi:hypothetical protein
MSHKCGEPGCGFHLPDAYPLPNCPWHTVPGDDPKKKAIAVAALSVALGVGYGVSKGVEWWKQTKRRNTILEGQERWRKKKRQPSDPTASDESASTDSQSAAG